jgi:5'(3')-deoxyribonucleotidase
MSKDNIILLDMDGVIVDMNPVLLDKVNKEFDCNHDESDLTSFRYDESLPKEHADFIYELWHDDNLYQGVEWSNNAEEAVEELRGLGRVVVVSSPMVGHGSSKLRWLYNHGFDRKNVVLASDKNLVHGHVLIEDRARNAENFPQSAILVDKPYNQDSNHQPRAYDWSDIVNYTKELIHDREINKFQV